MVNRDGDRRVLAAMASYGADLRKPAHTIHYLYFKSKQGADSTAGELRAAGYQNVRVDRAPSTSMFKRLFGPKQYSCIAETHAVPSESAVFATSDRMNQLAARHGGNYDGWEASIEK
ncbi:MAG: ribonuclease E inhibitor RraB [Phycisphaerales bacterium]|nr:ribonuclease E inhibitor RraB [Phycisphaerales bacterium]